MGSQLSYVKGNRLKKHKRNKKRRSSKNDDDDNCRINEESDVDMLNEWSRCQGINPQNCSCNNKPMAGHAGYYGQKGTINTSNNIQHNSQNNGNPYNQWVPTKFPKDTKAYNLCRGCKEKKRKDFKIHPSVKVTRVKKSDLEVAKKKKR